MAGTPDHSHITRSVAQDHPKWLQDNTEQSILAYMMEAGRRLAEEDPNWGFLTKSGGEKHLTLPNGQWIAVDAFIYKATQQVVDTLTNAVDPGSAGPTWIHKEKRPDNNWYPIAESDGGGEIVDNVKDEQQDRKIADLEARIAALEAQGPPQVSLTGKKIALRAEKNNKFVCTDNGDHLIANREAVGYWEEYIIVER